MALFWDYLMSHFQKKSSCGLYGAMGDIRGRDTDNAAGRHSIQTDQWPTFLIPPPFLSRMPFLSQPSQICWLVYVVAWFVIMKVTIIIISTKI